MGQEMQLQGAGRAGVLTIAEANTRLADFAQNKLQVLLEGCTRPSPGISSRGYGADDKCQVDRDVLKDFLAGASVMMIKRSRSFFFRFRLMPAGHI